MGRGVAFYEMQRKGKIWDVKEDLEMTNVIYRISAAVLKLMKIIQAVNILTSLPEIFEGVYRFRMLINQD